MEKSADENKGSFSGDRLISRKRYVDDENVDLELRLGLPLYGNFDVGYSKKPKILNPSNSDDKNNKKGISEFHFSLIQTSSLPLETEEEEREREESQSLEHLEAIRKRWEKMMNIIRVDKKDEENGSCSSSSSGASVRTNVRPLGSGRSLELVKKLIAAATIETTNEKSAVMLSAYNIAKARWMLRNFMIKMPRVSTRCDGPNGEKTDGLLFAYRKGVDVQIVCVCHGYFLSPAGFVKHAGGGDVENPLRHIVINPLPLW